MSLRKKCPLRNSILTTTTGGVGRHTTKRENERMEQNHQKVRKIVVVFLLLQLSHQKSDALAGKSEVNLDSSNPTETGGENDNFRALIISPHAASKSVQSHMGNDKKMKSTEIPNDSTMIAFTPSYVLTAMKNSNGQRIVEVCIWLPSGVGPDDFSVWIADDNKHLNFKVQMDRLMGDGWGLHSDLVPNGRSLTKVERNLNVRVHHWNTLIDDMRNSEGGLPWFTSSIALPEATCSKKLLRKSGKESRLGAKMLTVDVLIEDSKKPAVDLKRPFDYVDFDDDSSINNDSDY